MTVNHASVPQRIVTGPVQLTPLFKERVWGVCDLAPYFGAADRTIGEAWFTAHDNPTSLNRSLGELIADAGADLLGADPDTWSECPLLLKLLFTAEKLSVQVHPADEYANQHHQCAGKTEAWHVLHARPGAQVAVGFRAVVTREQVAAAAAAGHLEELLAWHDVAPGDTIMVPAGTVHAIGAGLTICEIQQNSDITYRIYDYGRPRELHLEHGLAVAELGPARHPVRRLQAGVGRQRLAECEYFTLEHLTVTQPTALIGRDRFQLAVFGSGTGTLAGAPYRAGQVWLLPPATGAWEIVPAQQSTVLLAHPPVA